ncbi:MAG: right-handed parallel beta-helix repeat-containing protein [Planctomycetota bacterium]
MHRACCLLSCASFILLFLSTSSWSEEVTLYVAPGGNAGAVGTKEDPFGSLERAATAAAERAESSPVRVLVRGGVYRLTTPIELTPEHSGTAEHPIAFAAHPGEKPVFSGGFEINGWKKEADGPLWMAKLPEVGVPSDAPKTFRRKRHEFRRLFVNGQPATVARTPNKGEVFYPVKPGVPLNNRSEARRDPKTRVSFYFKEGDIERWKDLDDAVLVYYHAWTTSRHGIKSLDFEENLVELVHSSSWPMGWWGDKERYYVENFAEALDAPGEWYLDREAGIVKYYPPADQDMQTARVVAPALHEVLVLQGDPAKGRFVEHLHFEGLTFAHTDWTMPKESRVDGQAAAFLDEATVRAVGARNCQFKKCDIAQTGGYGLWLQNGCQDNRIEQCELCDLGAGGVRFGETGLPEPEQERAERNTLYNCFVHDGGQVFHAGVGVWIGKSSHNTIAQNEICDFLYSGVSVGWSWGYAPSSAHHNVVEFNHIHHLGWNQLSDMGGIYHLGRAPGTVLRNNHIHDVMSYSYGGWGLYTDEGSSEVLMENNVVYRVKDGAFHQHYGKENIVKNNILAYSLMTGQIRRSREESHISFTCDGNIIFGDTTPPLGNNWKNGNYRMDNNVYWNTDADTLVFPGNRTFAEWQETGQDEHSIVADPQFVDPANGDFRLKPNSPALEKGFEPIDASQAGLVGDKAWTEKPKHVNRPPMPWPEDRFGR